jgi:hypothetical protein
MNPRFIALGLSLLIIGGAIVAIALVAKITAVCGDAYSWEYIPPLFMLIIGLVLFGYWICRIVATS